jgi:hypothetical protein
MQARQAPHTAEDVDATSVPDERTPAEILVDVAVARAAYYGDEGDFVLEVAQNTVETARQQVAEGNPNWTPEQTRALTRSLDRADRQLLILDETHVLRFTRSRLPVFFRARRGSSRERRSSGSSRRTARGSPGRPGRDDPEDDGEPHDVVHVRRRRELAA